MKSKVSFICGILVGSLLFGGGVACAVGILAEASTQHIFIDGKEGQLEAYLIDGHNYLQLRDVGKAVGFNVYWDEQSRTVNIESGRPYTGTAPAAEEETGIDPRVITGSLTDAACSALRNAIKTGSQSKPVAMPAETKAAMQKAAAAVGCWPVYDLKSEGGGMYSIIARFPEPYEEAAAYCQPFIDSLADLTDREEVLHHDRSYKSDREASAPLKEVVLNELLFDMSSKLCGPELDRRAILCEECTSKHCAFNSEGICTFPLIYGRKAMMKEEAGCLAWVDADEMDDRDY